MGRLFTTVPRGARAQPESSIDHVSGSKFAEARREWRPGRLSQCLVLVRAPSACFVLVLVLISLSTCRLVMFLPLDRLSFGLEARDMNGLDAAAPLAQRLVHINLIHLSSCEYG